jgi:integrase
VHAFLKTFFRTAVRYGYAPADPTAGARAPALPPRRVHPITVEQFCRLLRATPARWRPLVLTAGLTGLRWGELVGLEWADVDLEAGVLIVRRAVPAGLSQPHPPKSQAGARRVDLLPPVRQALLDLPQRGRLVFPAASGGYLSYRVFARAWRRIRAAAGLAVRFHDLRHFAASLLLAWGRPVLYVAAQLGHHAPSLTLDIYGHLLGDRRGQVPYEDTLSAIARAYSMRQEVPVG